MLVEFFKSALWPSVALVALLIVADCVRLIVAAFGRSPDEQRAEVERVQDQVQRLAKSMAQLNEEIRLTRERAVETAIDIGTLSERLDRTTKVATEAALAAGMKPERH